MQRNSIRRFFRTLEQQAAMAISATINKISLNIANMDTQYYQSHELTVAQHPSENDYRFMIRVIAFMLNASDQLSFTKGLSSDDEPELWQKTLTDDIELWIDLGQVDEKRIRKACGRAKQVIIYTYHEGKAKVWREQLANKLQRFKNLSVLHINAEGIEQLVKRTMQLQCNIQEGEIYLSDDELNFTISLEKLDLA
ncbi:MAG: YaeQ family protein [Methyloprofundus sp.]|nr:YaeQ family protein [Methyloprofundus sp.]